MGIILRHKAQANVIMCQHGDRCTDCCWDWAGWISKAGYGRTNFVAPDASRETYAHRVAWIIANRQAIPRTMVIHHRCDNRACCNPAHLWLGTHKEGLLDQYKRGRERLRGELVYNSKLTEQKVMEIRRMGNSKNWTQQQIAHEYGVSQVTVSHVLNGKRWGHVEL